jgi:hypothetical protein
MRTILHAKFGDELPKRSAASDEIPRTRPTQQLRNSVEEFEVALTKARAAWRASRGPTRTATRSARIERPSHVRGTLSVSMKEFMP